MLCYMLLENVKIVVRVQKAIFLKDKTFQT